MRRLYELEWSGFGVLMWIYRVKPMVENWEAAGYILSTAWRGLEAEEAGDDS
jgi:hypothetical protein